MKLAPKLTLVLLVLAVAPIVVVGYLAYENGRQTIEQKTIEHLVSTNHLKSQHDEQVD